MTARRITGREPVLLLCDHASAAVPADIDLGIAPTLLDLHIAVDIGAAALTAALAARIGATAMLGTVSRLVIDLHREPDHPDLVPHHADGHAIPGNVDADRESRIERYYAPYHRAIAAQIRRCRPALVVAIHSFTPRLESGDAGKRLWQVGILSNRDRRAADLALAFLNAEGFVVGDNTPYSGRVLNTTLNRHGEANGIPSLSVEVRNDEIRDDVDVARWCDIVARMIAAVRSGLARGDVPAT